MKVSTDRSWRRGAARGMGAAVTVTGRVGTGTGPIATATGPPRTLPHCPGRQAAPMGRWKQSTPALGRDQGE